MAKSKETRPVVSKKEPQISTKKQFFVISRVKDPEMRKDLEMDDKWQCAAVLDNEDRARDDYQWFIQYRAFREHKLVCMTPVDPLDDPLPKGLL